MQRILGLVRRCVEDYHMIEPGDRVAVGVSGGKDSLLTLAALARLREFYPVSFTVEAITLEMGMPGMDFGGVAELCRKLEVPYTRIQVPVYQIIFEERREKNPCSLCAKLRRGSLNTALTERGIHKIALGHHYDDAVETLLMNLLFEGRIGCFQPVTYLDRTGVTQIRPSCGNAGRLAHCPQPLSHGRSQPPSGGKGADRLAGAAVSRPEAEAVRQPAALPPVRVESDKRRTVADATVLKNQQKPSGGSKAVSPVLLCTQYPLDQQQQAEPRHAQYGDHQRVEEIQPETQARVGGGEVQRPQRAEPQSRIDHQPQRQLQRRFEQPPDGHQQKQQHQP